MSKHMDTETMAQVNDLHTLGVGRVDELCHVCLGMDHQRIRVAKVRQGDGLVILEDSAAGPMVTRTHRGTMLLRKAGGRR